MKTSAFIVIFLLAIIISSCKKEKTEEPTIETKPIIGNWIIDHRANDTVTYKKVSSLPSEEYGISIKIDNTITEHKNAGFCGTPPVFYEDFMGTWSQNADTINFEVYFMGDKTLMTWLVLSSTQERLTVKQTFYDIILYK